MDWLIFLELGYFLTSICYVELFTSGAYWDSHGSSGTLQDDLIIKYSDLKGI